jgi:hypothetical protein
MGNDSWNTPRTPTSRSTRQRPISSNCSPRPGANGRPTWSGCSLRTRCYVWPVLGHKRKFLSSLAARGCPQHNLGVSERQKADQCACVRGAHQPPGCLSVNLLPHAIMNGRSGGESGTLRPGPFKPMKPLQINTLWSYLVGAFMWGRQWGQASPRWPAIPGGWRGEGRAGMWSKTSPGRSRRSWVRSG